METAIDIILGIVAYILAPLLLLVAVFLVVCIPIALDTTETCVAIDRAQNTVSWTKERTIHDYPLFFGDPVRTVYDSKGTVNYVEQDNGKLKMDGDVPDSVNNLLAILLKDPPKKPTTLASCW